MIFFDIIYDWLTRKRNLKNTDWFFNDNHKEWGEIESVQSKFGFEYLKRKNKKTGQVKCLFEDGIFNY